MGRILLGALAAGAVAFLAFHLILDLSSFVLTPEAAFLSAPGGLSGAALAEFLEGSSYAYWTAGAVALIVAVVTPLVRWSAARDGEIAPAPAPLAKAAPKPVSTPARAAGKPAASEFWKGRKSGEAAAKPVKAASAAPEARWTPQSGAYAASVGERYGATGAPRKATGAAPGKRRAPNTPAWPFPERAPVKEVKQAEPAKPAEPAPKPAAKRIVTAADCPPCPDPAPKPAPAAEAAPEPAPEPAREAAKETGAAPARELEPVS